LHLPHDLLTLIAQFSGTIVDSSSVFLCLFVVGFYILLFSFLFFFFSASFARLGAIYEQRGDWKNAFLEYSQSTSSTTDEEDAEAHYKLALCYMWGLNAATIDEQRAFALFETATRLGSIQARSLLACCLENGAGCTANRERSGNQWHRFTSHCLLSG
jgi:hypothetical protein